MASAPPVPARLVRAKNLKAETILDAPLHYPANLVANQSWHALCFVQVGLGMSRCVTALADQSGHQHGAITLELLRIVKMEE